MGVPILKIENLTKSYGKTKAISNISLSLNEGEIFGFIGPNGAGKSTTIRSIMNLINKDSGSISIYGKEFDKSDIETKAKIGYLSSEINLYEDATVKQILDFHEKFYNLKDSTKRKELLNRLDLDETKKIENLSLGNKKKLGIVLSLMHNPKLLILDEPTSGLDPIMQQEFYNLLLEEKKKGTTILYSTHILNEISKICDRVAIIKDGEILKIESINELKAKNLTFVTIESKNIKKIIKTLKVKDYQIENKSVKFAYSESINILLKILSEFDIDKLLIQEASLEDIFMHYYIKEETL